MVKSDYVKIFNDMIRGTPISYQEKILPIIADYLTEINCDKSDKLISFIAQDPNLAQIAFAKVLDYYMRKYCILSLTSNNKILMYYE